MEETSRFIGPLLRFLFPAASDDLILSYHFYISKLAHFTEYAVLGFLAVRTFAGSSFALLRSYRFVLALIVVGAVALADEFNQSFEPSRTGAFSDVLLDTSGGLIMIVALFLLKRPKPSVG